MWDHYFFTKKEQPYFKCSVIQVQFLQWSERNWVQWKTAKYVNTFTENYTNVLPNGLLKIKNEFYYTQLEDLFSVC
jgi:hypothetical protein